MPSEKRRKKIPAKKIPAKKIPAKKILAKKKPAKKKLTKKRTLRKSTAAELPDRKKTAQAMALESTLEDAQPRVTGETFLKTTTPASRSMFGPIPPPGILDGFGKVDRSFPERIVAMAEKQLDRRTSFMSRALELEGQANRWGQGSILVIVLAALALTGYALYTEQQAAAAFVGTAAILTFVANALIGKKSMAPRTNDSDEAKTKTD